MENIIEPDDTFDFKKLSLAHPVGIQGGAYFTKIEYNGKPLYIQTCKSKTRQGIVKTGKKYYCDLMFDTTAASIINWFENLEEMCQKLIFEKRDTWFENKLEESDIEAAFNSTIRVFKSGKNYLVRANVRNHNNNPFVKIYSENQLPLTSNDINDKTDIISILEIQGIKFTSRNFQIDVDLKQVMILDNEPLFNNCLINPANIKTIDPKEDIPLEKLPEITNFDDVIDLSEPNTGTLEESIGICEPLQLDASASVIPDEVSKDTDDINIQLEFEDLNGEIEDLNGEIEDLNGEIEENINKSTEIDNQVLDLENKLEPMQLKKPNQVYFELYKDARDKAKLAKKNALIAYLEAKNIKKTYLIDNLIDSDSDIDDEIDDVSESELDGL
ncbi:MAG: hypothetical protein MUP82_04410 [Candidatus Marinimicrobia bacterium]|nr:hypothetical protein [Candidatus Neomarinimicrobiota bacterium]